MKAWELRGDFGLDNLAAVDRPDPVPGPGEVRVRLSAASLNFRDLLMVQGLYDPRQRLPLIPGSDGVGLVDAVGPGVATPRVGDRVAGAFNQAWAAGEATRELRRSTLGGPLDGTLAEAVLLRAEGAVPVPAYLSDQEAATLPCAGVTAWSAVVDQGGVRPGQVVLVQGTGGVSIFALQLARLVGAEVIVTSSSDAKLARARELGAHHGINYGTTPEWQKEAREITGGRGVDLVVEVGGAGTMARSLGAVRVGGTVAVIGVLSGRVGELDLAPLLMQRVRLQGVIVGSRAAFEELNRALALHRLHPVVDRVFPFEAVPEAFRHLAGGTHLGKVVVRVGRATE